MLRTRIDEGPRHRRWWAAAIVALSSLGVVGTGAAQLQYEYDAGSLGTPVVAWPEGSAIERTPSRATLLMFVHPRCSCTTASLAELAEVIASHPGAADVVLVVDVDDDPSGTATAIELAGARVVHEHGEETERFGVATSGEVMVFDASGKQTFVGGITRARGLRGVNPGRTALEAALLGAAASAATQVFGCPLTEPTT